jgi:hydrogenase maturation factor
LTEREIQQAQNYLFEPGIGVTRDARIAVGAGHVTAMHDPTEGGIVTALWELAEASRKTLRVDASKIPVPALARRVCAAFGIDVFSSIASGSLLITAPSADATAICAALRSAAIDCSDIGVVEEGPVLVERTTATGFAAWPRPVVDGITRAFGA